MTRAILLDRLAVARRLGVSPKTVDKIRERIRRDLDAGKTVIPFPEPVPTSEVVGQRLVADSQHTNAKLYRQSDVDRFARLTGRRVIRDQS